MRSEQAASTEALIHLLVQHTFSETLTKATKWTTSVALKLALPLENEPKKSFYFLPCHTHKQLPCMLHQREVNTG